MTGEIKLQDLVISKLLGKGLDKYRSLFPHVSAAIRLAIERKSTSVGGSVEYIFTNGRHTNPLYRVTPLNFINQVQDFNYDKEKYREMLFEAAETVLGLLALMEVRTGTCRGRKTRNVGGDITESISF